MASDDLIGIAYPITIGIVVDDHSGTVLLARAGITNAFWVDACARVSCVNVVVACGSVLAS